MIKNRFFFSCTQNIYKIDIFQVIKIAINFLKIDFLQSMFSCHKIGKLKIKNRKIFENSPKFLKI